MKKEDCIFCKLANGEIPTNAVYENEEFKVILDLAPASKGHCLVIPKNHYENALTADEEVPGKAMMLAVKVGKAMKEALGCDGVNILQNNGEAAGQTVFHLHIHVIPRWKGDGVGINWENGSDTPEGFAETAKLIGEHII